MTKEKNLPRHLFFCFAFLFILCNLTVTFGQPLPPAAQEAINKGIIAAKIPDYLLAISYFEEARKIAPQSAEVFFNLGLAESKIPGRELRAICWFGAYLTVNPEATNASLVKEQMVKLEVINKSNVSHFLITIQDAAVTLQHSIQQPISDALYNLTLVCLNAGDITMAQKVCDLMYNKDNKLDLFYKSMSQSYIGYAKVKAGDIDGAKQDLDKDMFENHKTNLLVNIAYYQSNKDDIASAKKTLVEALKTANKIDHDPDGLGIENNEGIKGRAMANIAEAQLKIGDIESAQKTVRMIKVSRYKDIIDAEIAEAQKKPLDIKNEQKTLAATQEPTDIKLSDWIKKLDDNVENDDCPLNTALFLDLDNHLKSLVKSDDPGNVFWGLEHVAEKIVGARKIVLQLTRTQIGN